MGAWTFGGQAGPYVNALTLPSSSTVPTTKAGSYTELRLENKWEETKFKANLALRTDAFAHDAVETFQFIPKNFYLQQKAKSVIFKLGVQTLINDGPDVINPADVVHSKNWVDPTTPITMGSAGLSISQEIEKWSWEVFYIPYQTKPVLPGAHSPWLPRSKRLPVESENIEFRIPDKTEYQYIASEELDRALKNNFSAKLQRKSERFEIQAVYYQGLSQTPFLLTKLKADLIQSEPIQIYQIKDTVKLVPLYYRQQVYASTFVIPFTTWSIKGGWSVQKPYADYRVPSQTTTTVIGVEKNYETSRGMITGIFQYIEQQRLQAVQISFLRSLFQKAWSAGLRIPWNEELNFLVGGLYDQQGKSSLYRASAQYRLSNSWSLEAGAQYLEGPKNTLIGLYSRYDSYQGKLLYSW